MADNPYRLAAVDDELEIGFDQKFEGKWHRIELVSQGIMALLVVAAVAGLFGRGPFSHRTHQTADGRLAVDFEPVARWGTTTQVTVHLSLSEGAPLAAGAAGTPARVFVNSAMIEPLGLQRVVPRPQATQPMGGGAVYEFVIPPGQNGALVRFVLKPSAIGPVDVEMRAGGQALSWTQVVLP